MRKTPRAGTAGLLERLTNDRHDLSTIDGILAFMAGWSEEIVLPDLLDAVRSLGIPFTDDDVDGFLASLPVEMLSHQAPRGSWSGADVQSCYGAVLTARAWSVFKALYIAKLTDGRKGTHVTAREAFARLEGIVQERYKGQAQSLIGGFRSIAYGIRHSQPYRECGRCWTGGE